MKNEFELSNGQLIDIAKDLSAKISHGLTVEGSEIRCLPTFIQPSKKGVSGVATVFDLGGTNFRAATVKIGEKTEVLEQVKKNFVEMKRPGYTKEDLFEAIYNVSDDLKQNQNTGIGYCFSYPAKSMLDGDGELLCWTKGVSIPGMEGQPIGKTMVDYLNKKGNKNYGKVTVVNDTITSLFAGLSNVGYDAYIGLIVGTGTNMASFFPADAITKLDKSTGWSGDTPVNLESGNFSPMHLTKYDEAVDAKSDNPGRQRFEKAISGMYVGRVFREVFPNDGLPENTDAAKLGHIMRNPSQYSDAYVNTAYNIYVRSAKLVAASIVGMVDCLKKYSPSIRKVMLLAEGTMFWSNELYKDAVYANLVDATIKELLPEMGMGNMSISIDRMQDANLIGAAVSVLS